LNAVALLSLLTCELIQQHIILFSGIFVREKTFKPHGTKLGMCEQHPVLEGKEILLGCPTQLKKCREAVYNLH